MANPVKILNILADDPEIQAELKKLDDIMYEYRGGRLLIGAKKPLRWEVRRSVGGQVYCTCPNWAYKARKRDGMCKHVLYALSCGLEIPVSGEKGK